LCWFADCNDVHLNIPADEFVSKKITNKLVQQIQVGLILFQTIISLNLKGGIVEEIQEIIFKN
jgi:hypothetical protein